MTTFANRQASVSRQVPLQLAKFHEVANWKISRIVEGS